MRRTEKAARMFLGVSYIIGGILILRFQQLLVFLVAMVFIFHGILSVLNIVK
ncbi:MAG: hypothetical protein PWR30_24 [Candidatus Woesearchaeota archaeon]|nr:hypothetical protein [Candidatus Woesearchaeota archaeon]